MLDTIERRSVVQTLTEGYRAMGFRNAEQRARSLLDAYDRALLALPRTAYVIERGLTDSPNEPQGEIVGIFSTAELAQEAASRLAPRSGSVMAFEIDGEASSEARE